jgi:hypothetical protein
MTTNSLLARGMIKPMVGTPASNLTNLSNRSNMLDELDRQSKTEVDLSDETIDELGRALRNRPLQWKNTDYSPGVVNLGGGTHSPFFERFNTPKPVKLSSAAHMFTTQGISLPDPSFNGGQDTALPQPQMASRRTNVISADDLSRRASERKCREAAAEPSSTRRCNIFDEERDSTSSQGSFILPPPVNWHKEIISRRIEPSLVEHSSGDQEQTFEQSTRTDESTQMASHEARRDPDNQGMRTVQLHLFPVRCSADQDLCPVQTLGSTVMDGKAPRGLGQSSPWCVLPQLTLKRRALRARFPSSSDVYTKRMQWSTTCTPCCSATESMRLSWRVKLVSSNREQPMPPRAFAHTERQHFNADVVWPI